MQGLSLGAIYHSADRPWGGCGFCMRETSSGLLREREREARYGVLRSGGKDAGQGRSGVVTPRRFRPRIIKTMSWISGVNRGVTVIQLSGNGLGKPL